MVRALACVAMLVLATTAVFAGEPVADFVRRHWATPIPPQGPPPEGWSPLESSLAPEACGTCHPVQYNDWRTSVHATSMGPGIAGLLDPLLKLVNRIGLQLDAAQSGQSVVFAKISEGHNEIRMTNDE